MDLTNQLIDLKNAWRHWQSQGPCKCGAPSSCYVMQEPTCADCAEKWKRGA